MNVNDVFWGFHIYAQGDALVKKGFIALGWPEMGDLGKIVPTRDAFKAKAREIYGDQPHITNSAGQLFRFVCEMKPGDAILYRSKVDKEIHIGRVKGSYEYQPSLSPEYCNVRSVGWLKAISATRLSQGALHELGSALTLFQVKKYGNEYQSALIGESPVLAPSDDETVAIVADQVEQTTLDFVLKELDRQMKGYPFQGFVASVLRAMGYRTHIFPKGTDDGVDILVHRDELKLEPPIIKVQVKSGPGSIGGEKVKQLFGNLASGELGLFITLGTYSAQAKNFASSKPNLRLIDGNEFVELVLEHYEHLDSQYKTIIPLKHVYIPQPPQQEEV